MTFNTERDKTFKREDPERLGTAAAALASCTERVVLYNEHSLNLVLCYVATLSLFMLYKLFV